MARAGCTPQMEKRPPWRKSDDRRGIEVGSGIIDVSSVPCSCDVTQYSSENIAERKCRDELVFFGQMLHQRHYVSGRDGNLSVRLDAERILTTPTGISKGLLKQEHLVITDLHGIRVEGMLQPSSEIGMHLTIYRTRPDVRAVVHAHPIVATAFACAGMDLSEPVCSELALTLGRIPLAPYAPPGSAELAEGLRPFISEHDAILMQNHGVVAYGEDLSRAYLNMETVEHSATIAMMIRLMGAKPTLNRDQLTNLLNLRELWRHDPRRRDGAET
jgi:L-fuculose-phosphate aldolase